MKSKATVSTEKGARYMKALINHFSRKIDASYEGEHGQISFGFGRCDIEALSDSLAFVAESASQPELDQLEGVINSHLKRFTQDEIVTLDWKAIDIETTA